MNPHPIRALGDMLAKAGKPKQTPAEIREEDLAIARRAFIGTPVLNINSLDPNDPHGFTDVRDRDREEIRAAQLDIEVNSATFGNASTFGDAS